MQSESKTLFNSPNLAIVAVTPKENKMTKSKVVALSELNELFAVDAPIAEPIAEPINAITPKKKPKAKKAPKAEPVANPETFTEDDQKLLDQLQEPVAEPKKEPVMFKGFEVDEHTDIEALTEAVANVSVALEAISGKDSALLSHYLDLGRFQSGVVKLFKGTKTYGAFLKAELPASQALDPALRSNCKWLYEALNMADHEASDLLSILGVNRIEDFKSANPTVIKREYKAIDKKTKAVEKAKELGLEVSEEEAGKAVSDLEKKASEAATSAAIAKAIKRVRAILKDKDDQEATIKEAVDLFKDVLTRKQSDAIEYLNSL